MRILGIALLSLLLLFLSIQIYGFWDRAYIAKAEYENLREKFEKTKTDNEKLKADLEYLSNPQNLEKELRARFNYRESNEKMIIIIPKDVSSTNQ